ncbi:MAG: glycosyltransferase [bacterium]|nr:glycosyltransferase [bacterium]
MFSISGAIFFVLIFLVVYIQVFFLVTFFENRKKIVVRKGTIKLTMYPAVTIVVPCWNEEGTVYQTVRSLLELNYPKDKLKIFLIDDGSTDNTLNILKKFKKNKNVKIFHKENGGKHTALNLGLERIETSFFGCLDADSVVDPEALMRIMSYFEKEKKIMAVTPSIIVNNPRSIIQNAQKVEYHISIFTKRMLAFLGAIHVTPGPFTIFKKEVFENLGPYTHAHNTEDMEIAYRMQKNHYPIEHCNDAYVYTNTPGTIKKLYRQRLRWIYGFINNTIDYRDVLFRKKYGNFSTFTVPAGIISIFTVSFIISKFIYNLGNFLFTKISQFYTIGFNFYFSTKSLDPFFLNTGTLIFVSILIYILVIISIVLGRRMIEGKWRLSFSAIYFFTIFSVIAPFWLMKAVYDTIFSQRPVWR